MRFPCWELQAVKVLVLVDFLSASNQLSRQPTLKKSTHESRKFQRSSHHRKISRLEDAANNHRVWYAHERMLASCEESSCTRQLR